MGQNNDTQGNSLRPTPPPPPPPPPPTPIVAQTIHENFNLDPTPPNKVDK